MRNPKQPSSGYTMCLGWPPWHQGANEVESMRVDDALYERDLLLSGSKWQGTADDLNPASPNVYNALVSPTYITLHYITLHYITLHYITLHCRTLHCRTLHYITLHYITLHYIKYLALPYVTLHCITLHYITLYYITL